MARAKKTDPDGQARLFPPLPLAPGRRDFATSWWGGEWIAALEETSMDSGRLSRGRTYARHGAVGEITVLPGLITAKVEGSRPRPYASAVRIQILNDRQWDLLLDAVAAKALHIAALLDRDMPQGLADDAASVGVHLLPHGDELEPDCSCPDWGYPCKHAAALCYQIARIIDEDPFVLLLMRGRAEATIMAELHRRNTALVAAEQATATAADSSATAPNRTPAGVPARQAFADWQPLQDQDAQTQASFLISPVAQPSPPAVLDTASPGIDPSALELLAADAAARAKTLLDTYLADDTAQDADPPPLLPASDPRHDAIRLLAGDYQDPHVFLRLAAALDVDLMDLQQSIAAWRHGGALGLEVLEEPWTPPAADLARARTLLAAGWDDEDPPTPKQWRNRWTFAEHDLQLRYGRDGRWYPYRQSEGAWWPDGAPGHDPADVLTALR